MYLNKHQTISYSSSDSDFGTNVGVIISDAADIDDLANGRSTSVAANPSKLPKLKRPLLIGINGEIGCGKSTACAYLNESYGFTEYMFAKPLKDIAVILGFEQHQVFGTQEQKLETNKFWGISGRKFLQVFGSEVCRDFVPKALPDMDFNHKTMWVRLFEKYYSDNKDKPVVVSDVRFEDESNTIRSLGGYVIRVERDVVGKLVGREESISTNMSPMSTAPTKLADPEKKSSVVNMGSGPFTVDIVADTKSHTTHKSELQADKIKPHVIIKNNGSLLSFYLKLKQFIELVESGSLDHSLEQPRII